ncbi:MAG: HEPN domain-containing protein [Planctomycetota bacterium]|nr:MAG: HEPN domain-containing protein [Planctomycetota bacterium]
MPDQNKVIVVIREWLEKAENDLKNAAHTLKLGKECPTDTACYHVQQCVEKYLKAVLVWKGIAFPKTHNIAELINLVPSTLRPGIKDGEEDRLTEYATITRYPGDYEPISLTEARRAVKLARRVRREVRKILPKETLKSKRK